MGWITGDGDLGSSSCVCLGANGGGLGDLAGFSHPHTYLRLSNGNVLATFQYKADSSAPAPVHRGGAMAMDVEHPTGGLVEMDERGTVIRSGSAADTNGMRRA